MVKKRNLFSQITDSRFYEGEPIQTWYVTDNISMTNSSQSYTTTVNYEGDIDTSSTRYGPQGIEYYEYVTTTNGTVTATVHPYEYVLTTSQKDVEVVKNTSTSDSYLLPVEKSFSFTLSEDIKFTYQVGRVADMITNIVTVRSSNIEKEADATVTWNETISCYNDFGSNFPSWSNYRSVSFGQNDLTNNSIQIYVMEGSPGTAAPAPVRWRSSVSVCVGITYKSFENNTTSWSSLWTGLDWNDNEGDMTYFYDFDVSTIRPYLTYYSSSTTWNTLTTVINTYEVPAQTTSSWVVPKQVSSLI